MLIKRNQHIAANLKDKTTDILIFHEGNIREEQQNYIQSETPDLFLKFIDLTGVGFKPEKATIPEESNHGFSLGYRHMCSFWFVDFWHLVEKYDTLLRIDEDCFADFSIDDLLFNSLTSHLFIAGGTIEDQDFVTVGLNGFSLDFLNRHLILDRKLHRRLPIGPFTHLMLFRINKIRENTVFKKYVEAIDQSEMIYRRRWGDLPLWGEAIHYIFGENTMKIDTGIKYYHTSHNSQVN
jgi:hypothetical protein